MNSISRALGMSMLSLLMMSSGNAMNCPKLLDSKASSRLIPVLPPRPVSSNQNTYSRLIPALPSRSVSSNQNTSPRLIPVLPPRPVSSNQNTGSRPASAFQRYSISAERMRLLHIYDLLRAKKNLGLTTMDSSEMDIYNQVLSKIPSLYGCFSVYEQESQRYLILNLTNVGIPEFNKIMESVMRGLSKKLSYSQDETLNKRFLMYDFQLKVLNNTAQLVK